MTIREATVADVPRLVALTRRFIATSGYAAVLADNPAAVTALVTYLIEDPAGLVLVADTGSGAEDAVVGLLGVALTPSLYSGERVVLETIWWVEPEARGPGLALLRAAERWAAEQGAVRIEMIAPVDGLGPRVGQLYQRRGYRAVETHYVAPVTPAMTALTLVDDIVPTAYGAAARAQPFGDLVAADLVFHGMALPPDDTVPQAIRARWPHLTPTLSLLRQSPAGQVEPHLIHTDDDMGDWTAITYLTADPAPGDGTTFYRQRATGALTRTAATAQALAWEDLDQWEPWTTVPAKPSRLVLFPSGYYHARALPENYGAGDTARLIQVTFGTGGL